MITFCVTIQKHFKPIIAFSPFQHMGFVWIIFFFL